MRHATTIMHIIINIIITLCFVYKVRWEGHSSLTLELESKSPQQQNSIIRRDGNSVRVCQFWGGGGEGLGRGWPWSQGTKQGCSKWAVDALGKQEGKLGGHPSVFLTKVCLQPYNLICPLRQNTLPPTPL